MTKWSEISIHTTAEATEAVANILHEAGTSGVVIEDPEVLHREWESPYGETYDLSPQDYPEEGVIIKGYLPVNSFLGETVAEIKAAVNNLLLYDIDLGPGKITLTEVNEEDWAHAWKKYYKPVHVTDRLTVTPTWETYESPPEREGEIVIELDPGMAFGTGTHPTTVLCMKALERTIRRGDRVIDVGCGSGVLSITAAKLGAGRVLALDLDEMAVKTAKLNAKINKVDSAVEVKQNNLLDRVNEESDVVVANILAEVIVRFTADVSRVLRSGGTFIASGIIAAKESLVKASLVQEGMEIVESVYEDDWVAIIAKKV